MKKLKLNLGDGGLQGWLVRHVEKFVLVLFVLVMVWFVIRGTRLEGIKSGQSPDVLKKDAQQAVAYVNADRWPAVAKQPERQARPNVERDVAAEMDTKANPDNYRLENNWKKPLIAKLEPRSDPTIYAPTDVIVVPIVGQIALLPDATDVDTLAPVEAEEAEDGAKKPVKKPVKKPAKKAAASGPPSGMGMSMPGGGGKGKKGKGGGAGMPMGGAPGMSGAIPGMEGDEEGGMGGMMGKMSGMGGMGGGGMPGMGGGGGKSVDSMIIGWRPPATATIRTAQANVVMALVPLEKQTEEFDAKLLNSLDHDPDRDRPHYKLFAVQRVDVTDNPTADPATLAPEAWKQLGVKASLDEMATWAGAPRDIMDPAYLMPLEAWGMDGLTQPLPPFVQRNLWEAMTHPEIPLAAVAAPEMETPGARRPTIDDAESADEIPTAATGTPRGGTTGGGMMSAGPPGGGKMGGGMMSAGPPGGGKGMMSAGPPGGGGGGMMSAGPPGGGKGMMSAGPPGGGGGGMMSAGPPGGGKGMMSAGPPGGGMGGMSGSYGPEKLVKYKLIRFNDFTVEKGRKYRYRVKVYVEDPNYPSDAYSAPSLAGLDTAAQTRVQDLDAKDAKSGKPRSSHYLASAYSPASGVVSLPPTESFYAGKVEPGNDKFYSHYGTGTSLTVVQDDKKHVDVPGKFDVFRGSTLNFTLPELDVIHPALGDRRKLEKYSFQTNAVVADMRGGEELPQVNQSQLKPLKAPGEVLFIDAAGNMHVRDEVDDIEYFHRFVGPPEAEKTKKKKPDEDAEKGFEGMMMPGAPGAGAPGGP